MLLKYKHKISTTPVQCLLDSGSDKNLFPASWCQLVGIKLTDGVSKKIGGIGGVQVTAYTHKIELICDNNIHIKTEADFSTQQNMPLLGRNGFFNFFDEVIFDLKITVSL